MKTIKTIEWHKADYGVCWKGLYSEEIHFTIIESRDGEFMLQIPRTISKGKGIENIPCETLLEAQQLAVRYI